MHFSNTNVTDPQDKHLVSRSYSPTAVWLDHFSFTRTLKSDNYTYCGYAWIVFCTSGWKICSSMTLCSFSEMGHRRTGDYRCMGSSIKSHLLLGSGEMATFHSLLVTRISCLWTSFYGATQKTVAYYANTVFWYHHRVNLRKTPDWRWTTLGITCA